MDEPTNRWTLDIPVELLAECFEHGVIRWGLGFLPPLCSVSKLWNDIIQSTPKLWRHISLDESIPAVPLRVERPPEAIMRAVLQFRRCASTQIHLSLDPSLLYDGWVAALLHVTSNTPIVSLDAGLHFLFDRPWSTFNTTLIHFTLNDTPNWFMAAGAAPERRLQPFLNSVSKNAVLQSLTIHSPNSLFTTVLLSSSLRRLVLKEWRPADYPLANLIRDLSTSPHLQHVEIECNTSLVDLLGCLPPKEDTSVDLMELSTLRVTEVWFPLVRMLLSFIRAPSLNSLVLSPKHYDTAIPQDPSDVERETLKLVEEINKQTCFADVVRVWAADDILAIPSRLRFLTLIRVLKTVEDVKALIQVISRTPMLISLVVEGNIIGQTARCGPQAANLFLALSDPESRGQAFTFDEAEGTTARWLCPSLRELRLEVEEGLEVGDMLLVARGRGVEHREVHTGHAERLRTIHTLSFCTTGSYSEQEELKSLVDHVSCRCFGCELAVYD